MNSLPCEINLSTRASANGRISGMSSRSPLNRTVDSFLASSDVAALAFLRSAIEARLAEVSERRDYHLRRMNRTNSRLAANSVRSADIEAISLRTALRRLAA